MKHKLLPSVEDLRKNFRPAQNVNDQHQEKLSPVNKLALWITNHVGSMGFFIVIFCWTVIWLGWNSLAPTPMKFDPFPAFVLWLFISNMIQIFLMPLIMIGQNLQSKHSELRAEEDFEINKKAEAHIETILMHLENQNEVINQILQKVQQLEQNEKS